MRNGRRGKLRGKLRNRCGQLKIFLSIPDFEHPVCVIFGLQQEILSRKAVELTGLVARREKREAKAPHLLAARRKRHVIPQPLSYTLDRMICALNIHMDANRYIYTNKQMFSASNI